MSDQIEGQSQHGKARKYIRLLIGEIERIDQTNTDMDERHRLMRMIKAEIEHVAKECGIEVVLVLPYLTDPEPTPETKRLAETATKRMVESADDEFAYRQHTRVTQRPDGTRITDTKREIVARNLIKSTVVGIGGIIAAPFKVLLAIKVSVGKWFKASAVGKSEAD